MPERDGHQQGTDQPNQLRLEELPSKDVCQNHCQEAKGDADKSFRCGTPAKKPESHGLGIDQARLNPCIDLKEQGPKTLQNLTGHQAIVGLVVRQPSGHGLEAVEAERGGHKDDNHHRPEVATRSCPRQTSRQWSLPSAPAQSLRLGFGTSGRSPRSVRSRKIALGDQSGLPGWPVDVAQPRLPGSSQRPAPTGSLFAQT
jgi:hypothetical protein